VCAIPPAIQRSITVSAVDSMGLDCLHPGSRLAIGAPAANAARLAPEQFFKNSRLFHLLSDMANRNFSKLIEIQGAWQQPTKNPAPLPDLVLNQTVVQPV